MLPPEMISHILAMSAEVGDAPAVSAFFMVNRAAADAVRTTPLPERLAAVMPTCDRRIRMADAVSFAHRLRAQGLTDVGRPLDIARAGQAARRCLLQAYVRWALDASGVHRMRLQRSPHTGIDVSLRHADTDALATWAQSNGARLSESTGPSVFGDRAPRAFGKAVGFANEDTVRRHARAAAVVGDQAAAPVDLADDILVGHADVIAAIDVDTLASVVGLCSADLHDWVYRFYVDPDGDASPCDAIRIRLAQPSALDALVAWLDAGIRGCLPAPCAAAACAAEDLFPRFSDVMGLHGVYLTPYALPSSHAPRPTLALVATLGRPHPKSA